MNVITLESPSLSYQIHCQYEALIKSQPFENLNSETTATFTITESLKFAENRSSSLSQRIDQVHYHIC